MADREMWRKHLPKDFDGRHADEWDGEVRMAPIVWSTVAVALSVIIAFGFCWFLMGFMESLREEPVLSPIAEANERRLPPKPWVQPKPEMEMDELREQLAERMSTYGWSNQLDGMVHIPVDQAKELVLASAGTLPRSIEPAADQPVDVQAVDIEAPEASGANRGDQR